MIAEFLAVPHSYPVPSFRNTGYTRLVFKPGQFYCAAEWKQPGIYIKQAVRASGMVCSDDEDVHGCCFLMYASSTTIILPIILLLSVLCAFVGIVGIVGKWRSC
jgi:hypothetical protein